jgi:hypothetical protein
MLQKGCASRKINRMLLVMGRIKQLPRRELARLMPAQRIRADTFKNFEELTHQKVNELPQAQLLQKKHQKKVAQISK